MSDKYASMVKDAMLNNSFDNDVMSNSLKKTWFDSFSYLLTLQQSNIEYEELCFFSGEKVSRDDSHIGKLYLNKSLRACFDVDYDLIHVCEREEYRTSDYYLKFFDFIDLVNHPEIFVKMPIVLIDDQVIWDYKIYVCKDYTSFLLPFKRSFVLSDEFDTESLYIKQLGTIGSDDNIIIGGTLSGDSLELPTAELRAQYKYINHKIQVLVVDNSFYHRYSFNKNSINLKSDKTFMIPKENLDTLTYNTITEEVNKEFCTKYNVVNITSLTGTQDKKRRDTIKKRYKALSNTDQVGTMMCSIHYPSTSGTGYELGTMLIPLTEYEEYYLGTLTDDLYNQMYNSRVTFYVSLFFVEKLMSHEFYTEKDYTTATDEGADIMVIEQSNYVPYSCPIPVENFMVFKKKIDNEGFVLEHNKQMLELHYPNIYRIKDEQMQTGEVYKIFYFYHEEPELKYTVLFDFYFRFLYNKFGTMQGSNVYISQTGYIGTEDNIVVDGSLENGILTLTSNAISFERLINMIYYHTLEFGEYTEEQKEAFYDVFKKIYDYKFFNHQYGEIDFLHRYIKIEGHEDDEPFEYKVNTLKEWIKVEPWVLRDYVLDQKKLGTNYHLFTNTLDLTKRIRTDTSKELDNVVDTFDEEMYVFSFNNDTAYPNLLDMRIFVDGLMMTKNFHYRKLFVDYIYIPKRCVTDDSYIEVEIFPAYVMEQTFTINSLMGITLTELGTIDNNRNIIIDGHVEHTGMYLTNVTTVEEEADTVVMNATFSEEGADIDAELEDENTVAKLNNTSFIGAGVNIFVDGELDDDTATIDSDSVELGDDACIVDTASEIGDNIYRFSLLEVPDDIFPTYSDLFFKTSDGKEHVDTSSFEITTHTERGDIEVVSENPVTKPVRFTRLRNFDLKIKSDDLINKELVLSIIKTGKSMSFTVEKSGMLVVKFVGAELSRNFADDYLRIYDNEGRLIPKCNYKLFNIYRTPYIYFLDKFEKGDVIDIDFTPYRYTEICHIEDITPDEDGVSIIDLKDYIDKPLDIRYYDIYLNGRKLSINNVFTLSPYQITLVNIKSIYNLDIYERERDWEYFGLDYHEHLYYFNFEDLLGSGFMTEADKNDLIKYIIDSNKDKHLNIYPNTNDEEKQDYNETDKANLEIFVYYFDYLLPKTFMDPDTRQESSFIMRDNFEEVMKLYVTSDDETVYALDPDKPYEIDGATDMAVYPVGHLDDVDDTILNQHIEIEEKYPLE